MNVDQGSLQKSTRAIQELIRNFEKLTTVLAGASKQMGGLLGGASVSTPGQTTAQSMAAARGKGMGGNTGGGGTLGNIFQGAGNSFKNLAGISQDSLKIISDGLKKTVDDSTRNIEKLKNQLDGIADAYRNFSDEAKTSPAGQKLQQLAGGYARDYSGAISQRARAQAQMLELNPPGIPPPGGGGSGFSFGGMAAGARSLAGPLALGIYGANAINSEWRSQQTDMLSAQARTANAMGGYYLAGMKGSSMPGMVMRDIYNDTDLTKSFQNMTASGVSLWADSSMSMSTLKNPGDIFRNINLLNTKGKEVAASLMQEAMAAHPEKYQLYQEFSAQAGAKVALMRSLGMGEKGMMNLTTSLAGSNTDISEFAGAAGGLYGSIGRKGGQGWAMRSLAMQRAGLDAGTASALASNSAIFGGGLGGLVGGMGSANIFAGGAMGAAAANASMVGGNMVGGDSLFSAMASGALPAGPMGQYLAQNRANSLGSVGGFIAGGDGLGKGIAALAAARVVDGGSINTSLALQRVLGDPAAVAHAFAGGALPSQLTSRGLTNSMIMSAANDSISMNLKARVLGGTGTDRASLAERDLFNNYGGDIRAFASKSKYKDQLGNILEDSGSFGTYANAQGAADVILGLGSKGKKGRLADPGGQGGGFYQDEYGAQLRGGAKTQQEFITTFGKQIAAVRTVMDGVDGYTKQFGDLAKNFGGNIGTLNTQFAGLSRTVDQLMGSFDKLGVHLDPNYVSQQIKTNTQKAENDKATEEANEQGEKGVGPFTGGSGGFDLMGGKY